MTVYSSIKELPIRQSKEMSKYLLKDAGIGSTIEDIDTRIGTMMQMIALGKSDDALAEAKNFRLALFSAIEKLDHRTPSMLCLVKEVDGQPWTDFSEEGLQRLAAKIENQPVGKLIEVFDEVKKNLIPSDLLTSHSTSQTTYPG